MAPSMAWQYSDLHVYGKIDTNPKQNMVALFSRLKTVPDGGHSEHSHFWICWDQNGSTSGPTPWQIYDDDEEENTHPLENHRNGNNCTGLYVHTTNKYI